MTRGRQSPPTGKVYLVGAGPGDAGLITRKGLGHLRRAEVVLYDRLVSPPLLGEAPARAERILVGKSPGRRSIDQREIERLMIDRARQGRRVVRLKGGDPFVFGRGGEEALTLKEAGIAYEVVPGVTSPVAAPLAAGIPVTHRGLSGAFAVWTAHRAAGKAPDVVDAPTQVILMGVETLEETARSLVAAGRSPDTPAAVISWGTTVRQRTVYGTLGDIAERVRDADISSPATIVVGEVVQVGRSLIGTGTDTTAHTPAPFLRGARTLRGKRVALSRTMSDDPLRAGLEAIGAEVAPLPIESFHPLPSPGFAEGLLSLRPQDQVAFADALGVREAFRVRFSQGFDLRSLAGVRIVALSESAKQALVAHGLSPDADTVDPAAPALIVHGTRPQEGSAKERPLGARTVWAGELGPCAEVIRCLIDMAIDGMIDAVVFHHRLSRDLVFAAVKDLNATDVERFMECPAYVAADGGIVPLPLIDEMMSAPKELTV